MGEQDLCGYREALVDLLGPLAADVAPRVSLSEETTVGVAFLVDRARRRQFVARVQWLQARWRHEIALGAAGPLPPYSFSMVEVARLRPWPAPQAGSTPSPSPPYYGC